MAFLREGSELEPPPGWALVRVIACGICGTDVHLLHGMTLPRGVEYPVRPGHEVAGLVERAEPNDFVKVGDLVVLHPAFACGTCPACRRGADHLCAEGRMLGIHDDGGLAEMVSWPTSRMRPANGLDPRTAAVLADAVATAHHTLKIAEPPIGGTVSLLGAGGVGTHVVQIAKALDPSLRVIVVARSEATALRAESFGAEVVRGGLKGAARRVRDLAGACEVAIDFTGDPAAPREARRMLARGGRLILGSVVDEDLNLGPSNAFVTRGLEVRAAFASRIADLEAVIEMTRSGALDLSASVTRTMPLSEAPRALEVVAERPAGLVRLVVTNDGNQSSAG